MKNITQLIRSVEAETRESMRDHYAARLQLLHPHRINNTCYSNTFFSVRKSIHGYRCWQLFALKECCHDTAYLMCTKSQAAMQFEDYVREVGAPNIIIHDGAKEMASKKWLEIVHQCTIAEHLSKPPSESKPRQAPRR